MLRLMSEGNVWGPKQRLIQHKRAAEVALAALAAVGYSTLVLSIILASQYCVEKLKNPQQLL